MAVMIPQVVHPDIKSNAEKNIFEWFQNARGTEDWIVLHSLGIAEHQRVIHGEIDFLVLVPERGMFALEVKGGRVERRLGKWIYINKYGSYEEKVRSPFDQAWEGIYSVKAFITSRLDKKHEHLKDILFGIGVMFPDIEYMSIGVDEAQWQVFDINDGKNIKSFVERIAEGTIALRRRLKYKIKYEMFPTRDDVNYIAQMLRGDFDIAVPLKIKQRYAEGNLQTLTDEQAQCIGQLADNYRVLVRGSAGTGKTMLAIEATKLAVANGEKVGLLCYNRLLGEWLQEYFSEYPQAQQPAYVGSFHSYMMHLISEGGGRVCPSEVDNKSYFFKNELPQRALKTLREISVNYDRLIVDEAQDLLDEGYMDVMDQILTGGLRQGKWMLFGDFSMQAIYAENMTELDFIEVLQNKASYALFRLTKNCRNTRKICLDIENILGIKANAAFEDSINTPAVDHIVYENMEDQKLKLVRLITDLLDSNIQPSDVVILSPRTLENSVVSTLEGITIRKYTTKPTGHIRFSTIQAFKGLESSTVIITDIESYDEEKLIYVGLSRARFDLHIFESREASEDRLRLFFSRRINNER